MGYCTDCGEVMTRTTCKCGGSLKVIEGMGPPSSISNAYLPSGGLAAQVNANRGSNAHPASNSTQTQPQPTQQNQKMSMSAMKQNILSAKPQQHLDSCLKCGQAINLEQQVLQTANGYLHDYCLACSTCNKKIDNTRGFIIRGNDYHHPECVAPKCYKCNKTVAAETFIVFEEKQYHPTCFTCSKCNAKLGKQFYQSDSGLVCASCRVVHVAEPIVTYEGIKAGFTVDPITGQKVVRDEDSARRIAANLNTLGNNNPCSGCGSSVYSNEQTMGPLGRIWHKKCLKCVCGKTLDSSSQIKNGKPVCAGCLLK